MDATRTPNDRSGSGEGGFTLVELMVVLAVILILVAVVVPTYRGARERAQDRVAQLNVRTALIAARVIHSDYGGYGPIRDDDGTGVLSSVEPTLRYTTDGSQAPDEISVKASRAGSGQSRRGVVQLAVLSETEVCWHIYDDDAIGTFYGHVDLEKLNKTNASVQDEACSPSDVDTHLTVGVDLGTENVVHMQPLTGGAQFRLICFYEDGWQPAYRPRARVEFQNNTCPEPLEP